MSRRVNITGHVFVPEDKVDNWDDEEEVREVVEEMTDELHAVGKMEVLE